MRTDLRPPPGRQRAVSGNDLILGGNMRARAFLAVVGAIAVAASLIATTGASATTERTSTQTATATTALSTLTGITQIGARQSASQASASDSFECSPNPTVHDPITQTCVITNQ